MHNLKLYQVSLSGGSVSVRTLKFLLYSERIRKHEIDAITSRDMQICINIVVFVQIVSYKHC